MKVVLNVTVIGLTFLMSCSEFLAVKPDTKLAVPHAAKDLRALLDNVEQMNYGLPTGIGEVGSDNLFLPDTYWSSLNPNYRMEYGWEKEPVSRNYWSSPYRAILYANTVIESAESITFKDTLEKNELLGTAYFHRGNLLYELAQIFAPPFRHQTADDKLGLVLRLRPDVNIESVRSTVRQTYDRIIDDFSLATNLLSTARPEFPTRPNRASAYGAMARCYLTMGKYTEAGAYADSCLQLVDGLLDYNEISVTSYPFERFNMEVVYHSHMIGYGGLAPDRLRVDTVLYESFAEEDLRKHLFFTKTDDGYYTFTGDYGQNNSAARFNGITTAEMLLIRAECSARNNDLQNAKNDLKHLLLHRYRRLEKDPDNFNTTETLLTLILSERRKELVFRGQRWSDLRRMAMEPERSIAVIRNLNGKQRILTRELQEDFAYLIPNEIIENSHIPQN